MRNFWIILSIVFLSACDAASRSGASVTEGTNHRVRAGESLFAIAERAYGNGLEWPRIWEANQWIDPDHLRAGEIIHIPGREDAWSDPPPFGGQTYERGEGYSSNLPATREDDSVRRSANPTPGSPTLLLKDLAANVSGRTFLGLALHQVLFILLSIFLVHSILQGVLVWLGANLTFVKGATFSKSMKAVFLTECLTISTILALGGVAVLMLYLGTQPTHQGGQLFPALEAYLQSPTGLAVAAACVIGLYAILSLRFLPQTFGVPVGRAMTLMTLAILIPHCIGFYLIGQRTGMIR